MLSILIYNESNNVTFNALHSSSPAQNINNNHSFEHSIIIIKTSFKLQLAYDTVNYELHNKHQQQIIQNQMNIHNTLEM